MEIAFNLYYPDVFAIANSNVTFHQLVSENESLTKNAVETKVFLKKDSDVNSEIKCLAWHPSRDSSDIIALGHTNGRVNILSTGLLNSSTLPVYRSSASEYNPKHARLCNALSWNPFSSHLLAIGLEKSKSSSLIVWDINSRNDFSHHASEKRSSSELTPSPNSQPIVKLHAETAANESVNSLMWLKQDTIVAGINKKIIRIYDIRNSGPVSSNIPNKATCGLCLDPNSENFFACYGDKLVSVFDIRKFAKPVTSFSIPQPVSKIEWSPTRKGMLGVLFSSHDSLKRFPCSNKLYLYDMMNATVTDQDLEVGGLQPILRNAQPRITDGEWLCGFAWVPPSKKRSSTSLANNLVLTVSNVMAFGITSIPESTTVRWRSKDSLVIASGHDTHSFDPLDEESSSDSPPVPLRNQSKDLSNLIYQRVMNGYGLNEENPSKNIKLSLEPKNFGLHELWRWIERVKAEPKDKFSSRPQASPAHRTKPSKSKTPFNKPLFFKGIQNILKDTSKEYNATLAEMIPWIGVANTKNKIYISEKRKSALMLCDWTTAESYRKGEANRFGRNSVGEELVRRLQKSGSTERACAIAVWHLDIKLAIEILNLSLKSNGQSKYSTVAMAMSGYTGTNCPTLWLDTCRQLQNELKNPYLQTAFAFLISCAEDTEKFDVILGNTNILLQDRVAFACMFLPDSKLNNFISSLAVDLVKNGVLEGAMVVGLTTKIGLDLLQNYVDKTFDVQTAVLAVVHTGDSSLLESVRVQHWRDSYINFQNKWQLYFERVNFDLLWNKACSNQKTSSQVYLGCFYCKKSISNPSQTNAKMKVQYTLEAQPPPLDRRKHRLSVLSTSDYSSLNSRSRHFSCPTSKDPEKLLLTPSLSSPYYSRAVNSPRGRPFGGGIPQPPPAICCPQCRKPLPRCSVCSMHLGTHSEETDHMKWISWCMKCRHGGHHGHLLEWFESHHRCPVTDCDCCCSDQLPVSSRDK